MHQENVSSIKCHIQTADVVEITIEAVLAVPTFTIYLLLWSSYWKRKPRVLNDSFFTLYLLTSGLSMTFFIANVISMRITGIGLLCDFIKNSTLIEPSYIMTLPYFLMYYLPYAMLLSNIAISTNRMCAVAFPAHFPKISAYQTRPSIVIALILPLPCCWHLLISPIYHQPVMNGYGLNYVKVVDYPRNSLIHLIFHLVCGAIVASLTTATAFAMSRMDTRRRRAELALILVVAFDSLGTLLAAAQSLAMYYRIDEFLYQKRFIIVDYQCFCPTWSLFVLSSSVRREIMRCVRETRVIPHNNRRSSTNSNNDTSQF